MKKCYLMVGPSGAGKSTVRRRLVEVFGFKEHSVFSLDDCRRKFMDASHAGQWWSDNDTDADMYNATFEYAKNNEKEFNQFIATAWAEALKSDVLFIDNTNFTKKGRARWVQEARQKGFYVFGVEVMTPLQTVVDRQKTRGDKCVPEAVVRNMYMSQQGLLVGSEVDAILFIDTTNENFVLEGQTTC